jgi:release factor glutamine methyltransferase
MDMVIANPPYVSTADCARLARTVRDFEPHLALDGGVDGLRLISRLVSEAARVLTSGGKLLLEIAEDQAVVVPELLCAQTQLSLLSRKSDYAGNWRVVIAARNPR